MSKCEVFDGKQTSWCGLWWHPENASYSSASISLGALKKFKGNVRMIVKKNRFYNKGMHHRPNYVFMLVDAKSKRFENISIIDEENRTPYESDGNYYDENGKRLYTYHEVQYAINRAAEDGQRGYGSGDNIVEDYLEIF